MAVWQHNDWRSQATLAGRLSELRKHIAEVTDHVLGMKGMTSEVSEVNGDYLKRLEAEESKLTAAVQPGLSVDGPVSRRVRFRGRGRR